MLHKKINRSDALMKGNRDVTLHSVGKITQSCAIHIVAKFDCCCIVSDLSQLSVYTTFLCDI